MESPEWRGSSMAEEASPQASPPALGPYLGVCAQAEPQIYVLCCSLRSTDQTQIQPGTSLAVTLQQWVSERHLSLSGTPVSPWTLHHSLAEWLGILCTSRLFSVPEGGPSAWTVLLTSLLSASHPILSSTWFIHTFLLQKASITPHLGMGFLVVHLGCSEPVPLLALAMKWSESCSVVSKSLRAPCSRPVSSVHGILQARTLKWVAIPFSRGSSQPKDWTQVSCIAGGFFTIWATREALRYHNFLVLCLFLLQDWLLFENRAHFCFPLYHRNQHCQPHRRCLRSVSVNEWISTCSGKQVNPISLSWCCVLVSQENVCAMLVIVFLLLPTCPPLSTSPQRVGSNCLALITA